MGWLEKRTTHLAPFVDPLPNPLSSPRDFSAVSMSIVYMSLLLSIFEHSDTPTTILHVLETHTLVFMCRTVSIFLLPLSAPPCTVLLHDPLIESLTHEPPLKHDLFFSGHTAFVLIHVLFARNFWWWIQAFMFVLTPIFLFLQRVHYAIDIYMAPFVTYTCYSIVQHLFVS